MVEESDGDKCEEEEVYIVSVLVGWGICPWPKYYR